MVHSAGDARQALTHWTTDSHTGYAFLLMPWGRNDWLTLVSKTLFSGLTDGRKSLLLIGMERQRWDPQPDGLLARREEKRVLISGTSSTFP